MSGYIIAISLGTFVITSYVCYIYTDVSIFKIPKNTYKECHFFLSPQNYSNNNELSLQENVVYLNTDVWLIQLKRKSF